MDEIASQPDSDLSAQSYRQKLREALDRGTQQTVQQLLAALHPSEVAELLESLPSAQRLVVWELVPSTDDGEVLIHLSEPVRAQLVETMDPEELTAAAGMLETDDLAYFLDELPETVSQTLLASLDRQNREQVQRLLSFPEESAGRLMNTDTITIRGDVTLDVVLRYLRQRRDMPPQTNLLVVVDRRNRYQGVLRLRKLLTNDVETPVRAVMESDFEPIPVHLSQREVAWRFSHRDMISAPVVDEEGVLLGRITIDDVVDVIQEEAEHSVMGMAGLDEDEDMFAPPVQSARRRALWLGVNLLTALLAAWVISWFEATLEQLVALAVLMPVVASMGGIAGSQTLTLVVRGIALGRIDTGNVRWLLNKELMVGLLNGCLWALIVALLAHMWYGQLALSFVIAVALLVNVFAAALAGVVIPVLLERLRIDPALAGGVILTTVTDVVGFFTLLYLATRLLALDA